MTLRFPTMLFFTLFLSLYTYSQQGICRCDSVTSKGFQPDCKKKPFRGGAFLQYQFNCDSIWLTFRGTNGKTRTLYSIATRLHSIHDRVGYVFYKEFQKSLLFRKECVAPTGCNYFLVSKYSGNTIEDFGDLVDCPGIETLKGALVYLNNSSYPKLKLVVYNPDTGKRIELPLPKSDFATDGAENPNNYIESIYRQGRFITLTYTPSNATTTSKKVRFDLKKYGG